MTRWKAARYAGFLVVITVLLWGNHPTIHSTPSNILLRSSSAHSNSVLTFPNNVYRHACYSLSSEKQSESIVKQYLQCQQCKQFNVDLHLLSLRDMFRRQAPCSRRPHICNFSFSYTTAIWGQEFFSIKHDLARSCFQLWPMIGDEGQKISKK